MNKHFSLYIHIPFCVSKCNYCDFASFVSTESDRRAYFDTLRKEINETDYRKYKTVDSIYFGGGTPSSVDAKEIAQVMSAVSAAFELSDNCEISIESNPATLSPEKCGIYRSSGINRISLGVQAVQPHLLQLLGRAHTFDDAVRSVEYIRNAGFRNLNLDLMFALPQQTYSDWTQTLDQTIALAPEHISAYSLIVEEGTPFYKSYADCDFITDETDRRMYHYACDHLKKRGYAQYEISNFAKAGLECRHNLYCWEMEEYLGFGMNAHSFVGGKRFANSKDFKTYITDILAQTDIRNGLHILDNEELRSDFIILGLRKTQGIDLIEFKQIFHEDFMLCYHNKTEKLISEGLLALKTHSLSLTEKGLDYANRVMREFL